MDHLAVERGLAGATLEAYARDLGRLSRFLRQKRATSAVACSREDLIAFAHAEAAGARSAASRARSLAAVRGLFAFLTAERGVPFDPSDVLVTPRLPMRLPKSLSHDQLESLLDSPTPNTPLAVRDSALLELLYSSGMRASEIVGLATDDVSLEHHHFRCRGKGNKERMAPLGGEAVRRIERYLQLGRGKLDRGGRGAGRLFLSRRGAPLTRQGLWRIVKKHGRRAGLAPDLYPHLFRHSFATHLVEEGADLRVVQELLGHANVTTTQIYAHVDRTRLKGIHSRFHPRG